MSATQSNIDRRRFLQGLGVVGAGVVGGGLYTGSPAHAALRGGRRPLASGTRPGLWTDPRSWADGKVPGKDDIAVIERAIILEGTVEVAGVQIGATGALIFAPASTGWLRSRGNVVVQGSLVLRPLSADVEHKISFIDIDESRFVGGGMHVVDSDVGLWVIEGGVLDAVGTPKASWTNLVDGVNKGARKLACRDTAGWRVGDRVVVTPTVAPDPDAKSNAHAFAYDDLKVTAVSGGAVTLESGLVHPHPAVADSFGNRWTPEVLNLTRNVVIEGSAAGRAHVIFAHTHRPQNLSDVELRHLGPRQTYLNKNGKAKTDGILGRYPLHFHMNGSHSEGSVVRSVVVHDSGNHGFVPHESHGITFDRCVAHDTWNAPYWWDVMERGTEQPPTNHITWSGCVASLVRAEQSSPEAYRLTAFHLGKGEANSNVAFDCVAVGVDDGNETSGFSWPELSRGIWEFSGCVAHNNVQHGIMSWQNTEDIHIIRSYAAYHNGRSGIVHGAYSNFWLYEDCDLYANRYSGLEIHAVTRQTSATKRYYPEPYPLLTFRRFRVDAGGSGQYGITSEGHRLPALEGVPVLVADCDVRGARDASFRMGPWNNREEYEIVDCRFDGAQFLLDPGMNLTSHARVRNLNADGLEFSVWPSKTGKGTSKPEWNACVSSA